MMKSRCEEAVKCFHEGFNCSQAVFATYSELLGLDRVTALKTASPFGAGIARTGETCGAVTGALMLIGLKEGKYLTEDEESKEKCYRICQEFMGKFKEIYGSVLCREILSCDLSTENGQKFAKEHNLTRALCPGFVRDAAKIVEQLLELDQEKDTEEKQEEAAVEDV